MQRAADKAVERSEWMAEDLGEFMERGLKEKPPLPHSFFERGG